MVSLHPIVSRLGSLHQQWQRFVRQKDARLLVWQASADEAALIAAFVTHEGSAEAWTHDLFVQLRTPFARERSHGLSLVQELCAQYAQAADALADGSTSSRWRCPPMSRTRAEGARTSSDESSSDIELLGAVLASFQQHHCAHDAGARLVVWLDPSEVVAPEGYRRWLRSLVQHAVAGPRFFIVDDVGAPGFLGLARAEPARVVACACALDMPSAFVALAAELPHTPGAPLRLLQTRLAVALAEGAVPHAEALARSATQLATERGWPHLAACVQMMLAAGLSRAQRPLDALRAYGLAEQLTGPQRTSTRSDVGHAAAAQTAPLQLHAKLGRAAVLLGLCSYARAAELYLESAALAHALSDGRLELDGYRLASVCYSLLREPGRAWPTAMQGLTVALRLDDDTRRTSTLLFLADHLVRLTRTSREFAAYNRPLERQLTQLLGPEWHRQLEDSSLCAPSLVFRASPE
jgi:tetratricopeptide (TPR) repeat protein